MAASKRDISEWFDEGVAAHAALMLVVCDTFDYSDYPVFAESAADCLEKHRHYTAASFSRVMEVYDLRLDKAAQMRESRAWHLP